MGYLSGYLAFMAGIFMFLHWLLQPVQITNAGQSAYIPPPQTRLVPLARKMDAPALDMADAQPLSPSLTSLAQVEEARPPSNNEFGRRGKKRNRTETATRESRRVYAFDRHYSYQSYARYPRSYRW